MTKNASKKTSSRRTKKVAKKATRKAPKARKAVKTKRQEREGYHLPVRSEDEQFEGVSEDLLDAWVRLRSFLMALGPQESHTSHKSIMFGRETCYTFVRPKKSFLEVTFFLASSVDSEIVSKVTAVSKKKFSHVVKVTHSDQIERPLTDWLKEAYRQAE